MGSCPSTQSSRLGSSVHRCGLLGALPHCRMLGCWSPGTTYWRWDWAMQLLFAPQAPGFLPLILYLFPPKTVVMRTTNGNGTGLKSLQEFYGIAIYTWDTRGEGLRELPVHTLLLGKVLPDFTQTLKNNVVQNAGGFFFIPHQRASYFEPHETLCGIII